MKRQKIQNNDHPEYEEIIEDDKSQSQQLPAHKSGMDNQLQTQKTNSYREKKFFR